MAVIAVPEVKFPRKHNEIFQKKKEKNLTDRVFGVLKLRTCLYLVITYDVINRTELDYRLILIIPFYIVSSLLLRFFRYVGRELIIMILFFILVGT